MAFVGEGRRKPVFEEKGEDDSIPSEDGRAGVTGPETAVGVTSPKAAVAPATTPETGGSSSAPLGEDIQPGPEVMQHRPPDRPSPSCSGRVKLHALVSGDTK
ncbi:unnamed protein product [Pylaiella littoralis]